MSDLKRPLRWPELAKIGRNPYRLQYIVEVRLEHNLLVITPENRAKFYWLVCGKLNPDFGNWLKEQLYHKPQLFEELNFPSPDTILKDNRELEKHGFFSKAKKVQAPAVPEPAATMSMDAFTH